jgi:1-aminocyclopropane-1-carboxylate deaminase/D-cysteine desulfhydrase-like pyridoxal-dependent ACC family enzyme
MVAAVAAKIGMKCRLIQESWVPHEDAVYDRVGNILLSRFMGPKDNWLTRASTSVSARVGSVRWTM